MKGIKRIRAKNYAGYDDVEIVLDKGVNYFYGPTDSGKSSVIRMIEWCLWNQPMGFHFAQKGIASSDIVSVEIEFFDGTIVERRRNERTVNEYVLNKDYDNSYKALKGKIPDRIAEAINMQGISLQKQEEQFFLIDLPPKQLAKKINESVDLSLMDNLSFILNKKVRDTNKQKELTGIRIANCTEKIKKLSWVVQADKDMQNLISFEKKLFAQTKQRDYLTALSKELHDINLLKKEDEKVFSFAEIISFLLQQEKIIQNETRKFEKVSSSILNFFEIEEELALLKEIKKAGKELQKLFDLVKKAEEEEEELSFLYGKQKQLSKLNKNIAEEEENILFFENKYEKSLEEMGVCPLCNKPF